MHTFPPELPSPKLASMSEVRAACMKVVRATRPTELGYSYEELKAMDDVSVSLLPEKKGMVFKHVEYLVESKVRNTSCNTASLYYMGSFENLESISKIYR